MSTNDNPGTPNAPESVGDVNVQKLLAKAYRPEDPEPAFALRVREAMLQAARDTAFQKEGVDHSRRVWRLVGVLAPWAAAAAVLLISLSLLRVRTVDPALQHAAHEDGGAVQAQPSSAVAALRPAGLTARARAEASAPQTLGLGAVLQTQAKERRRVALPDGSILYVNQNTQVKLEAERRLVLSAGEVYVEVARRPAGPSFTVQTPDRQITALGTKFEVSYTQGGTGVLVTQGKVKVSNVELPLSAGQQLAPNAAAPSPAPRASHALDWTRQLVAAAQSPLVPNSQYDGGALIVVDPNGQEARLTLRTYTVDVHIEDGFARTTIDQTYFNHENRRLEGTFFFPLPPDASLSRLAMYVDGKLMEGGMAEREHARNVYESIVYTQRDPALLEWVDGSTFKMRVFPLEARQEKRIILSYTQKLASMYARMDYRFPAGHSMSLVRDWAFHATIKNGAEMQWACDSHALTPAREGADLVLSASARHVKPDRDIVLHLADAQQLSLGQSTRFSAASHEGYRYVMLRHRPHLPAQALRQRRDWVFLFESSGARTPILARAQVDIVKTMLEHAEAEDTFAIVTAGTRTLAFSKERLAATPENIQAAIAFLEKTHLIGALDLGGAIEAVLPLAASANNPHLVHLGTAIPTLGQRQIDQLANRIPANVRYVGVGVGKNYSRQFMRSAAARTGGYFTQINPDEAVAWRAFELVSTLNTPRLLEIKVTDNAGQALLGFSDALIQGEELVAVGRYQGAGPAEVTVSGTLEGRPYKQVLAVNAVAEDAGYLPRMWAKQEIDRLLAENAEANKPQIIALSKQMYVMSPYTSLLVLENEQMYQQFNVDRGRKDHWAMYPAPQKIAVVREEEGAGASTRPAAVQKRSAEQVLESILVRIPPQPIYWPNQRNNYSGSVVSALQLYTGAYMLPVSHNAWDFEGDIDGDALFFDRSAGMGGRFNWYYRDDARKMNQWAVRKGLFDENRVVTRLGEKSDVKKPMGWRGPSFPGQQVAQQLALKEEARAAMGAERFDGFSLLDARSRVRGGPRRPASVPFGVSQPVRSAAQGAKNLVFAREPAGFFSSLNVFAEESALWRDGSDMGSSYFKEKRFAGSEMPLGDRTGTSNSASASFMAAKALERIFYGYSNLLYQRPYHNSDWRVFGDLLRYAPGMNTTEADIWAVLEAEAEPDPAAAPGAIDPAARALIERARALPWQAATIAKTREHGEFTLTFDGQGRYRYERTVGEGLREIVVCDGKSLVHLYPELGVGARRVLSRFHHGELAQFIPFALPSAEDLARGHDVTLAAERTVAIAPVDAQKKDEQGKVRPSTRLELVFSAEGRLAEQRWVEMPSGKVSYRQTHTPAGVVTLLDAEGKAIRQSDLALRRAEAPVLVADAKDLVVLSLPLRTRAHVVQSRGLRDDSTYQWNPDDALAVLAADLGNNTWEAMRIAGHCFFAKGDRRIGFYSLLLAAGHSWQVADRQSLGNNVWLLFDPVADHPDSPLARYVVDQLKLNQQGYNAEISGGEAASGPFIARLAAIRQLYARWSSGRAGQGSEEQRRLERRKALDLARSGSDPYLTWGILSLIMNYGGDSGQYLEIAAIAASLEDAPGLAYVARYEQAGLLYNSGAAAQQARELFVELYTQALEQGMLPPIDHRFRSAIMSGPEGAERFTRLMREASAKLIARHGRQAGVYLAWQCHQLGDQALGEDLLASALANVPEEQQFVTVLAAVEYLWHTGQHARADAMLQPLLEDARYSKYPELWHLASVLANGRGMLARALSCLERAIDLEHEDLPPIVNLESIRNEYGQLLGHYQRLADAIATLEKEPPGDLVVRVVRAADRWRALDPEPTAACQSAARILQKLSAPELAWDYLTTPLAERSNEAKPWQDLAQMLRQQGDSALADRAYATAFELEPTNAQVLWERALLLQQSQRTEEARQLFQKLAEGQWQPRFNWIQTQARNYLGGK